MEIRKPESRLALSEPPEPFGEIAVIFKDAAAGLQEATVKVDSNGHEHVHLVERTGCQHYYTRFGDDWYAWLRVMP